MPNSTVSTAVDSDTYRRIADTAEIEGKSVYKLTRETLEEKFKKKAVLPKEPAKAVSEVNEVNNTVRVIKLGK